MVHMIIEAQQPPPCGVQPENNLLHGPAMYNCILHPAYSSCNHSATPLGQNVSLSRIGGTIKARAKPNNDDALQLPSALWSSDVQLKEEHEENSFASVGRVVLRKSYSYKVELIDAQTRTIGLIYLPPCGALLVSICS
jgi:hypothetical protein